ncbi:hypothetical protein IVB22_11500 [Bradyrhizobium sp. 190]|uniref:hypothetical protein n=1 Tax=Bradyrhizobium sp. 190 TaxID=2782658 RepID=UPI001FF7042C|nr:hypothetical protein [Bradyrhizobium sp. 190]MCK1513185.1 hypothetical protein [Bradyrhizobium sp. 190]
MIEQPDSNELSAQALFAFGISEVSLATKPSDRIALAIDAEHYTAAGIIISSAAVLVLLFTGLLSS